MSSPAVAAVELGGTKCIAAIVRGTDIIETARWPTGDDAAATLSVIADWLAQAARRTGFEAIGIGSFGPLCLGGASADYGRIGNTPKRGWAGVDVIGGIAGAFDLPVGFDTDVTGAALAEGRWGAAQGCATHVYLTIGTGIGGGVVVNGQALHGLVHPEIGHVRVRRAADDNFAGVCPTHGDCLEGLASGPAIAARAGHSAERLAPDHPVWALVAAELSELMSTLILTLSPQRIVIGGGVAQGQSRLLPMIHAETARRLNNYLPHQREADLAGIIVAPALGDRAGILGAAALALGALGDR